MGNNCSCDGFEGKTILCDVTIFYDSKYGLEKQFSTSVVVDCVPELILIKPDGFIDPIIPIDDIPPIITLFSPIDLYSTTNLIIDFNFKVTDDSGSIKDCNIIIDSIVNGLGISNPLNDSNYSFNRTLNVGDHNWSISCSDVSNNNSNTGVRNLTILDSNLTFYSSCWSDIEPHTICNCDDLNKMRVNLDWNYILSNDINMLVSECSAYQTDIGFVPIGFDVGDFTGTFDGNKHEIIGLYINRTDSGSNGVGLFSVLNQAQILDLGLVDANIIGYYSHWATGSFAGFLTDSNISTSYSKNLNVLGYVGVGGLVGGANVNSFITNSYTTGNIVARDAYVGGLTGGNGVATNSYSTVNVYAGNYLGNNEGLAGGITGELNGGSVINSFATGTINGNGINKYGGVLGRICDCGGGPNLISNAYWFDNIGDLASNCYYNGNNNCVKIDDTNGDVDYFKGDLSSREPFLSNWDFENIWVEQINDFPKLYWEN